MEALSPRMGMRAMERLFATPPVRAVVAPLTPGLAAEATSTPFYAELHRDTSTGPRESAFLRHLQEVPVYERLPLLTRYIGEQVARVLGIQTPEELDHDQGFFELGMDSLTSIELRNRLQTALAVNLPSTLTFRYPTVTALSAYLTQYLPDDEPVTTAATAPADHLEAMSQDELAALLADKLSAIQEDDKERW
jgi:acyl carrier protein